MLQTSRGLGGSMPGEDLLRSARALSKGLRETEVPKEIIDTVTNLDAFIKEQQIIQAKVSALCQMSASMEESSELGKIQHLVELAPESKDLLDKTAASLENINCALRDMQVNVNLVWQKAQVAGLPLAGSSGPMPVGRSSAAGAPKLTPYFETTMRRLEEQVLLQQRRLDELLSALSSSQDPSTIVGNIPDVIASINQSIICLASKIAERHEAVARLQQKISHTGSVDFDDLSTLGNIPRYSASKATHNVGINPFQLASGSNYAPSSFSRAVAHGPTLGAVRQTLGLPGTLEPPAPALTLQPCQQLGSAVGPSAFGGGLRLSTPTSIFGTGTVGFGAPTTATSGTQPQLGTTGIRPWSSDTTNNRFSSSPAVGQLDLLAAGKRSRAL